MVTAADGNVEAVENRDSEVILTFLSHSFPTPHSLLYEHDGQPVSFDERIEALANGSVRIFNPTRMDSGEYTLSITNTLGSVSATINLTILCEKLGLLNSERKKCSIKAKYNPSK